LWGCSWEFKMLFLQKERLHFNLRKQKEGA